MIRAFASLWVLFFGFFVLMTGHGITHVGLLVRGRDEGMSSGGLGLIQSGYQFGWLLAALAVPLLVRQVGHVRVFGALAALGSAVILLFAVQINTGLWLVERIINGICIAGLMVVCESWLNDMSDNVNRGKVMSLYNICGWGAPLLGVWLLNHVSTSGYSMFVLSSVLVSVAVVPLLLVASRQPSFVTAGRVSYWELYQVSPLGVVGTFATGLGQGGFFSTLGIFATGIGMNLAEVSWLTSAAIFGGLLILWPFGVLSDRIDRRLLLTLTAGVGAVIGLLGAWLWQFSEGAVYMAAFALGAVLVPLYTVAVSHVNDHLDKEKVIAASGSLIMIYAVGSVIGPSLVGVMMSYFGGGAFFFINALFLLCLFVFALYRMRQSPAVPMADQESFTAVNPASPYATVVSQDEEVIEAAPDELLWSEPLAFQTEEAEAISVQAADVADIAADATDTVDAQQSSREG